MATSITTLNNNTTNTMTASNNTTTTTLSLNSQINIIITQIVNENADKITIENSIKSFNSLIGKNKNSQISLSFRETLSKWIESSKNKELVSNKVLENFLKLIHQSILFKTLKLNEFIEYMKWSESDDRLRGEISINILCTMEGYSYFKNFENALDFLSQFDYFKLSITTVDKVNKYLEILLEEDSDYINIEYIPMIENILNRIYSSNISILKPSPRIFNFILNLGKLPVSEIENHKKFIPMLRSLLAILAINSSAFLKLNKFIFRLIHIICDIPLSNYSFEKRQTIFKNHYFSIIPFIFENYQNCKEDLNKLKELFGEIVEVFSYQHLLTLIQSNRFEKVTLNIISALSPGPTLEKNINSIFNTIVCFINCDILRYDAYNLLEFHMSNFGSYLPELHSFVLPLVYKQQHNFPITTFKTYFKSHELLTLSQFPVLFKNLSTTRIDIINHTLTTHNKEIIETHYNNFVPKLLEVLLDPSIERPYYVLPSIGSSIQTIGRNEFFDRVVLNISNHLFSVKVLRLDNYDQSTIGEIIIGLFKIYKQYSKDYVNLWNLGINTFLHYLNSNATTIYLIPYIKDILEKYPIDSIPYVKQFEEKLIKSFETISINSTNKEIVSQYIELFEKLAEVNYFNFLYNYNLKPPQIVGGSGSPSNLSSSSSPNLNTLVKSQSINSFSNNSNIALHKSQSITLLSNSSTTNLVKSSSNGVLSQSQSLKMFPQPFVIHKFTIGKLIDSLKLVNSKFKNHKINISILKIIATLFNEFGFDKKTGNIKQIIGILNQTETIDLIKIYNLNNQLSTNQFSIQSIGSDIEILFNQLTKESRSFLLQYSKSFIRDFIITNVANNNSGSCSDNLTAMMIGDYKFKHVKSFFDFMISINGDTINNYIMEQLLIYEKFKKKHNPLLEMLLLYLIEDESKFPLSTTNLDYIIQLRFSNNLSFINKIRKVYGMDTLKSSKYFDKYYEIITIDNQQSQLSLSGIIEQSITSNGGNGSTTITSININTAAVVNGNTTATAATTTTSSPKPVSPLSPRPSDNKDLTNETIVVNKNVVSIQSNVVTQSPVSQIPKINVVSATLSPNVKTTSTITTITKKSSIVETKVNKYGSDGKGGEILKSSSIEKVESKPAQVVSNITKITVTEDRETTNARSNGSGGKLNEQIYKPTLISPNMISKNQHNSNTPIPGVAAGAPTNCNSSSSPTLSSVSSLSSSSCYQSLPPSPSIANTVSRNDKKPTLFSSSSLSNSSPSTSGRSYQVIRLKNHSDDYGVYNHPTTTSKPIPTLVSKLYALIIKHYLSDPEITIKEKIGSLSMVSKEIFTIFSLELMDQPNICKTIKSKPDLNSQYSIIKSIPNCFSMDSIVKFHVDNISGNNVFDKVHTLEINPKSLYCFETDQSFTSLRKLIITNSVGECVNPQSNGEDMALQLFKSHVDQIKTVDLNYNFSGLSLDGALDLEKDLIDLQLLEQLSKSFTLKHLNFTLKSIHSMASLSILYNNYLKKLATPQQPFPEPEPQHVHLDIKLSKQCRDSLNENGEQLFKSEITQFINSLDIHIPENDFIFKHAAENYLNLNSLFINLNTSSTSIVSSGGSTTNSPNPTSSTTSSSFLNLYLKNKKIKLEKLKFKSNNIGLINSILQNSLFEFNTSVKSIEVLVDLDTTTIYYDHMSIISGEYFSSDLNTLFQLLEKNKSVEKITISTVSNHNDMIFMDRDQWSKINTLSFKPIRLNSLNLFERLLNPSSTTKLIKKQTLK